MTPILNKKCPYCGRLTLAIIAGREVCCNSDRLNPCPSQQYAGKIPRAFKAPPRLIFDGEIR